MSTSPVTASTSAPSVASAASTHPRRWLLAFALYTAFSNIGFTQAVWIVYLSLHGYSPFAIGLFEMTFHLAKFVAEVPTGIFADLVGRRASLVAACLCGAVAETLMLFPAPTLLVVSFALSGCCYAFRGGAESAFVWSLAERSGSRAQAERFSVLFSRMLVVGLIALAFGQASGGYLGHLWSGLPFLCQSVAYALGLLPLALLPEQRPETVTRPRPLAHLLDGVRAVRADRALVALLLVSAIEASVFTTVNYYTQLYFVGIGFALGVVGLIYAAASISDFAFTALAPHLIRRASRVWLVPLLASTVLGGLALMGTSVPVLALAGFLLLFHAGDAILVPVLGTLMNERAPDAQRATVLSLDTGLFSAAMIVLFPVFGLGLTHASAITVYHWTGGIFAIALCLIAALAARARRSGA